MQSKNATGNLINRYKAVLKKYHVLNIFGSLAFASIFIMSSAIMPTLAHALELSTDIVATHIVTDNSLTISGSTLTANNNDKIPNKYTQAIFIDFFPLMEGVWEGKVGGGLSYEKQLSNYFTAVGEANFYTNFDNEITFSIIGHGRFYPLNSSMKKLFLGVGIGYRNSHIITKNTQVMEIFVSTGWKFNIGKRFLIEPVIGYRQNIHTFAGKETNNNGGITLNVNMGFML